MIKKAVPIIASVILAGSMSITAYADGVLDKDYIVSEIWSDWWLGKGDDGTIFPEASYKHHLLTEWVDDNYDDDDYDWTDIGELKYQFRDYYKDLIETWDFNDDNDGNWTISTKNTTYHFSLDNGKWLMIDSNGDTVDSFMLFSTLEERTAPQPDNSNNSNSYRVGENLKIDTVSSSEIEADSSENITETADTGQNEGTSNGLLYGIGALIIAGLGTIAVMLAKRKRG